MTVSCGIFVVGLGRKTDGVVREDHFVITVASEIMAILALQMILLILRSVWEELLSLIILMEIR